MYFYARDRLASSVHFFLNRYFSGDKMEKRLGFIGIAVDRKDSIEEVNRILTKYGNTIRGRIGVPNHENNSAVIGLITEGTNDEIGALTGKLGNLSGIIVKSALIPVRKDKGADEK